MIYRFPALAQTNVITFKTQRRVYARDRDRKNMLAYNEFAYKKTKDDCKLEDRFQKNGQFSVAYT